MEPDVSYEILSEYGDFCASTDNFDDARHYLGIYAQDYPVKLYKLTTYRELIDQST